MLSSREREEFRGALERFLCSHNNSGSRGKYCRERLILLFQGDLPTINMKERKEEKKGRRKERRKEEKEITGP